MKDEIAYALMNLYFLLTCFDKMLVVEISEKIKNSNKSKKQNKTTNNMTNHRNNLKKTLTD